MIRSCSCASGPDGLVIIMAVQGTILTQILPPQHEFFGVGWLLRLAAMVNFLVIVRAQFTTNIPAMFILGDSILDNGNNNYIVTLAKSNFLPNGLDFQFGPTGRFCNGRTVADVLGNSIPQLYFSQNITHELCSVAVTSNSI